MMPDGFTFDQANTPVDTEEHGNALDPHTTLRAMMAYNGLTQRGMDPDTALGYAANFVQESRGDPNTRPGDAGASHGIAMWNGQRLTNYIAQNGHLPEHGDLDEQLDHIMWENDGPEAANYRKVLLTPGGPEGKAAAVSQFWERPKDTGPEINRRSWIARQLIPGAMAAEIQKPRQATAFSFEDAKSATSGGFSFEDARTPGGPPSFNDAPDATPAPIAAIDQGQDAEGALPGEDAPRHYYHGQKTSRTRGDSTNFDHPLAVDKQALSDFALPASEPGRTTTVDEWGNPLNGPALPTPEPTPAPETPAPETIPAGADRAALETATEYGPAAATPGVQHPTTAVDRVASEIARGASEGWNGTDASIIPDKIQEKLNAAHEKGGLPGYLAALASTAAADVKIPVAIWNAAIRAFQAGIVQTGEEVGNFPSIPLGLGDVPAFARDAAALPEAFPLGGVETGLHAVPEAAKPGAGQKSSGIYESMVQRLNETPEQQAGRAFREEREANEAAMNEAAERRRAEQRLLAGPEESPPEPSVAASTPEPASDIAAQIDAMHDPDNPKDAVFVAAGNERAIPRKLPKGTLAIHDSTGTFLTTNPDKLRAFADGPVTDELLAKLLGYPETKAEAVGSGEPVVVQGKDAEGRVVAATASSPEGVPAAEQAIGDQTPAGGGVEAVSPVEAQQERAAKVASEPASGSYVMLDPRDLILDPKTFQFKASDEQGVTGALRGVTRWEPALANPITVWQSNAGGNYVVNGHQRTDLALRAQAAGQDVQMPAQIFREADGYTPEYMRALGAYQNIAEGSGTAIDAAKVLRNAAAIPDDMRLPDLPPRSQLVQQGAGLAKLSDDAFGMVTNEIVPAAYAAHVGNLISDPAEQLGAMQVLARAEPANSEQARLMVQDARDSGFAKGAQTGLFGDEDFARSLIPERARVLDRAMRNIRHVGGVFRAAVEGEESLTNAGNQLSREGNVQARTENDRLLDALSRHATTRGPISDALNVAAGELASGKPIAGVASRFLAQTRGIVRGGQEAGVQSGVGARGAGVAPGVDQAAAYREELPGEGLFERRAPLPPPSGTDLFGATRALPAARAPEPTIRNDPRQATLMGTEPSAVQAQAAHDAQGPRTNQLLADQGLFARPEAVQPELAPEETEEEAANRQIDKEEASHRAIYGGVKPGQPLWSKSGRQLTVPHYTARSSHSILAKWLVTEAQKEAPPASVTRWTADAIREMDWRNLSPMDAELLRETLFGDPNGPGPQNRRPTVSAWVKGVPGLRDMIATLPPGEPHEVSRQWVLSRGQRTGHEYLTAVDSHTGQIVHAVTQGRKDGVNMDVAPLMVEAARDRYTFHHNHPSESGFSPDDLTIGSLPGTRHIVAHAGPDMFSAVVHTSPKEIAEALRDADTALRPWLHEQHQAGRLSPAQYSRSYYDLQSRVLHAMGLIDYTSTRPVPAGIRPEFDVFLREKFHVDDPGQYTAAQRLDAALAGLRAPVGGNAKSARADLSGVAPEPQGRTEGQGSVAPVGTQGRLLDPGNGPLPPRETPNLIDQGPPKPPREPRATVAPSETDLPLPEPPQPGLGHNNPPPPDTLWPPDQQPPQEPPRPPEIEAARITRPQAVKNLNVVERGTIFPRVLASLDVASARFWNTWQARERDSATNADQLRKVITPNFLKLGKPERLRVGGALEIARIEGAENLIANPDGTLTYRNTSTPFARGSKVGDTVTLTPQETVAYHEAVQLGRDQWTMLMKAAAKRYGWGGDIDPAVIREAANAHGEPSDYKRLNRLADLLDAMRQHEQDIYFPMQRFGSYFIAIRPKEGEGVVANLGGHPPLAWFETVEKPAFQDLLGVTKGRLSVQAVAAKRIADLRKQFPPDRFDIQQGDFARTPSLLRKIDISAVEKLFMLMENKVAAEIQDQVMRGDNPPTTRAAIRDEAKSRYDALHGSTLEAFYDALFEELKSGYRRRAKVVPGYSGDFDRSISSHLYQIARNAADTVHRDGIQSAYQNIQDFHPHDTVKRYWANWRTYQEDPGSTLSRAADTMSQIGFTYVLGMNPSSTIIMASHTPMAAAPVLSVGVGPRVAIPAVSRGLGRAYAALRFDAVHGGHIDLDKAMAGMPAAKQAFLRLMAREGRLAAVGTHDMAALNDRLAGLFGDKSDIVRRGMEIATSNVHAVDQANRFAVASAAWDIASDPAHFNRAAAPLMNHSAIFRDAAQRDGLSPETYGRFMLSEAAFEWGKQNQPPIQRGPLGRLMFTLHGFQTRYLSTALNLMKNRGPEGKFAALLMLGALGLGAGMQGLPFVEDAENGIDALWHYFTGRDPDLKHKIHDAAQDAGFGKIGADMIMRGPLSVGLGVNLGSRIGFGDVLSREFESSNVLGTIPSIMWSAYSGGTQRAASGQNPASVAAEVVPFAGRGPLRAYAATKQGIVSRKGVQQIPPDQLSGADVAKLGIGFAPLKVTERQEETSRYIKAQHSQEAWAGMIKSGDREQARAAIKEMAAAGWGPGRVAGFIRQSRRPPGPGVQFQRFEHQRGVSP